jgi:hypothetical protein
MNLRRERERELEKVLTEKEETAESTGKRGVNEAADGEIKAGIPFGIDVILLRN